MTENEAIKELQSYAENSWGDLNESFELAIHALEEIQQYRELGTVRQVRDFIADWRKYKELGTLEHVREAVERMKPKKVIDYNEGEYQVDFICPNCSKALYGQPYKPNCCKHCGQKLDW